MSSAPFRIQTALRRRHVRRRDPMLFPRPTASAEASAEAALGIARRWNREPASGIHNFFIATSICFKRSISFNMRAALFESRLVVLNHERGTLEQGEIGQNACLIDDMREIVVGGRRRQRGMRVVRREMRR